MSPAFCETSCLTSSLLHNYDQIFHLIISIALESVHVTKYKVHKSNLNSGEFVQLYKNIFSICVSVIPSE